MKIGIVVGSVRQARFGGAVGDWVAEQAAAARPDVEFVTIDVRDFNLPVYAGAVPPGMLDKKYDDPALTAWSQAIDACDAFVFVTAEYNHSIPGGFKNAFDSLGTEWAFKPIGFVSYGFDGGIRAVEHWRTVVANFSMPCVRAQVPLSLVTEAKDGAFVPTERRAVELGTLLDQVITIAAKLGV